MVIVSARLTRRWRLSYRYGLTNAAIAASRVVAWPCVGVRSSWCPKCEGPRHGLPTGAAAVLHDAR